MRGYADKGNLVGGINMKVKIISLIFGIVFAIIWSIVFVNVLNSVAGICIGICFGIAMAVCSNLMMMKNSQNKKDKR